MAELYGKQTDTDDNSKSVKSASFERTKSSGKAKNSGENTKLGKKNETSKNKIKHLKDSKSDVKLERETKRTNKSLSVQTVKRSMRSDSPTIDVSINTSGRARRNIKTPNWKEILSGKTSVKSDPLAASTRTGVKDKSNSKSPSTQTGKTEKEAVQTKSEASKYSNEKLQNSEKEASQLKKCTIKLQYVDKAGKKSRSLEPLEVEIDESGTVNTSNSHQSLTLPPEKGQKDSPIRKGSRNKMPSSKLKNFEIEHPVKSKHLKNLRQTETQKVISKQTNHSCDLEAKNNNEKNSRVSEEKASQGDNAENKKVVIEVVKQKTLLKFVKQSVDTSKVYKETEQTSQRERNVQKTLMSRKVETPSSKNKGRPKGSKNKSRDDGDNEFETKVEYLSYTGKSGRPKKTLVKVNLQSEISKKAEKYQSETENTENDTAENMPKRKSKKPTPLDIVSPESMDLSDEEDILEWKGVGEMKNNKWGRPKGSALKKYEIIPLPEDQKDIKSKKDQSKQTELHSEIGEQTARSSSRVTHHPCKFCSQKFFLKYLLEEHYLTEHWAEKIKLESKQERVEKRGRKRKTVDKVDDKDKQSKSEDGGVSGSKESVDGSEIEALVIDGESGEIEDMEDQDWEGSDNEEDGDDDDDYMIENSRSVKRAKVKTEPTKVEYTCGTCQQEFKTLVSLQVHKIVHMKKDLAFECVSCKQKFLTRSDLQVHSRTAHKVEYGTLMYFGFIIVDGKIQCEICCEDFESMEAYHNHRSSHLSFKYLCKTCGHGFEYSIELDRHTQAKCTENEHYLKCEACGETFNRFETRKKHIKSKHAKDHELICLLCGLRKDDLESLKDHTNSHITEKIFKCEICDKTFNDKKSLIDHRPTHTRSNDVECPTCFKKLSSQKTLLKHMQLHTTKKKFSCKFCSRKFDSKDEGIEHEKTHDSDQEIEPQEHKCPDCGRVFSNKYRLQRHSQVHFEDRIFECAFCGDKFQTGSSLLVHKKTKHPNEYKMKKEPRVQICEHCGFKTTHRQRLVRHMQVHNTEKLFECEFCHKKFQTMTSCSSHKMIHRGRVREPGKKFSCRWKGCHKVFIKPASLRRHLNSHLFKVVSSREDCDCQDCAVKKTGGAIHGSSVDNLEQIGSEVVLEGAVKTGDQENHPNNENVQPQVKSSGAVTKPKSDSMDILQEAISQIEEAENTAGFKLQGNDPRTVIEELDIFPCPWCPATFFLRCKLVVHFYENHESHKFPICDVCNKVYLDSKNLKEHKTVHTGVKPHSCEVCNRVFRTKTALRQHSHIHSEIKPYVCSYCGHGFTQRGYFVEHVRRHTGERPYSCSICKKSFVSNDLRKRHMYSHTGNKPHQCTHCGKSFVEKSLLVIHLRTHENYRPFQCGKCDKAFFANAKLQRHLATVHHLDKRTLSDYFPTKISKGLGWRQKNKANKEKIKPETQFVVYIDQHGNIISRVEQRAQGTVTATEETGAAKHITIAPNPEQVDSDEENIETKADTQQEQALQADVAEVEQDTVKQEQGETQVQNIQILKKPEQGFIPLGGAIEVHTKRDASGQLQIYTIPQAEKQEYQQMETEFADGELTAEPEGMQELNEEAEVFQMAKNEIIEEPVEVIHMQTDGQPGVPVEMIEMATSEGKDVTQEGMQYATIVEGGENVVQHIEFITQSETGQEIVDNQQGALEIVTGQTLEQGAVYDNQNTEIYTQAQAETNVGNVEQLGGDFSINIGEDGTVNIADLEKIEALRNMYSDQQIVIVLENQNQQ